MIIALIGKVYKKEPTVIHLNVQGVVYEVFVSVNASSNISTEEIVLHITHVIREDAELLYGFVERSEKHMFDTLIKINGVGPKVAMAICSTYTPSAFASIVAANDMNGLKNVPGIGPKSAGRILVELSGFSAELTESTTSEGEGAKGDATLALLSLGFRKELISKVLKEVKATETSGMVKEALRLLQK